MQQAAAPAQDMVAPAAQGWAGAERNCHLGGGDPQQAGGTGDDMGGPQMIHLDAAGLPSPHRNGQQMYRTPTGDAW